MIKKIKTLVALIAVSIGLFGQTSTAYAYTDFRDGALDDEIASWEMYVEEGVISIEEAYEILNSNAFLNETNKNRFKAAIDKAKDSASQSTNNMVITVPTPSPIPQKEENKHTHKYLSKLTQNPTCTEPGIITYTCESCGDAYTEDCLPTGHQYVDTITKEPTCTTEGERTYKCSLCGDTYPEVIEAKGHIDGQFTITKEPTCTEPGEKTVYCKVCNEEIRTESIDPTGHENTGELITYGNFFSPDIDETRCLKCMAVLDTKEIPVPIWHYVVVGVPAIIILIVVIAVLVDKIKYRKKDIR